MNCKKNYRVQAPNATSVNILRSWLRAVGIQCRPGRDAQHRPDLLVEGRLGGEIPVVVALGARRPCAEDAVIVQAKAFTGKRSDRALEAFWAVTDACGYDRRTPVDRGAEPAANAKGNPRKLHYRDEDFLVSIRHTETRRSPNPPEDRWQLYRKTMEKCAWSFKRGNFDLCRRHGIEFDDIMQYCRCLVINFCARYETPEPIFHDNERKCYRYLQQRLFLDRGTSVRAILLKKERSTMPDAETVAVCLYGVPDADGETAPDVREGVDEGYVARHCELDVSSEAARRESADEKLNELLGAMPHDEMVDTLARASSNYRIDPVARDEAYRRLAAHQRSCPTCSGSGDVGANVDEQLPGTDTLSAASEVVDLPEAHSA